MASTRMKLAFAVVLAGFCSGWAAQSRAALLPDEDSLFYRRYRGADEVSSSDRGKDRDRGSQGRENSGGGDKASSKGRAGGGKPDDPIGR